DFSARIARNTQLYLQHETGITKTVDPWAGSYYLERLTADIAQKAWQHMKEIESLGGMTKAISSGIPKMRIEQAAARKQARIDSDQDLIIGVNKYQSPEDDFLEVLEVDNHMVRQGQIERLQQLKQRRNHARVQECLKKIEQAAQLGEGNLLALSIDAAKERATLGEISTALEKSFGRYKAEVQTFSGVYAKEVNKDTNFEKARAVADRFAQQDGRRPRIMIAKMGQDGHDRGAKVVATGYADIGFDVDIGALFQSPEEAVKQAVENDVHILGISSLAGGHKTLVPEIMKALEAYQREDIMVIVGGVIPKKDYEFLFDNGVVAVFGPGTKISEAAITILEILMG